MEWHKDGFRITDRREEIDVAEVHRFLSTVYWAKGIPLELVRKSLDNSLCFGLHDGPALVGFARAITDRATFAYLSDVFVLPPYRRRGLAKWLVSCVMEHPELQKLRRWVLVTLDAQDLYRDFGFSEPPHPEWYMEISDLEVYAKMGA